MRPASFFKRAQSILSRWRNARGGNVIVTFAIASVPIMGFVGAAVDYSRANSVKAAMQAAADSTALMLSRDIANLNNAQIQTKANDYFNALFNRPEANGVLVNATYTMSGGSQIVVNASSNVKTDFMQMMGFSSMKVAVESQVKWGNTKLRVALVLDTTGSMDADGKMPALKTAAKNLLTQLQNAAAQNGDVYVSIVPFSKNVNVGASNYNASWIDWTDWEAPPATLTSWIASNTSSWEQIGPGSSCPLTNNTHGFRCAANPTSTSIVSSIPSSGTYSGYICPSTDTGGKDSKKIGIMYNGCYNSVQSTRTIATGSSASCSGAANCSCSGSGSKKVCTQTYYQHNWVKNAKSTWNGCVTDRGTAAAPNNDYDRKVTSPSPSITASLFPAEQNSYCSPQVMELNYNWNSMKTAIDNLYPLGATNQPIGLVWGWQSLVGDGPFPAPPPKNTQYTYSEVIVLMSDGLNTLNRWSGNGSATSTDVDKRMHESASVGTCANIKAAGITIYSIHVNTNGDPMSTLLKNCASQEDKFWMVTSASGLTTVFNQIGTQLSNLRVSK